ncbi:MAG: bifunctional riboflavin kinase/FAD synthetase [Pseudomonadota bacterium]
MGIYFSDLSQITQPLAAPVLTIGNFDGIHLGHQSLFQKVRERAKAIKGTSMVITFHPHPAQILRPAKAPRQIVSDDYKIELIFQYGIEAILSIPFTKEFAQIPARDFIQDILVAKIGTKEIVVGYDYTFGRKREGNIHLLKELGKESGFKIHVHPPVTTGTHLVSSTRVRELITSGAMEEARLLLGRPFCLSGTIIAGKGIGRSLLGFPTANLNPKEKLMPQRGVYVVRAEVPEGLFFGVTNVGFNPTFAGKYISVETFLFNFQADLYGRDIKLFFLKRLRGERTFSGPETLKAQIAKDIEQAKSWLSNNRHL